jgi:hypothetical protein
LVIGHSSLVIVVDLGKSNGALSTGVSEPAHGGGCRPLAIILSGLIINSWFVSQLNQVNPDISVFQVDFD